MNMKWVGKTVRKVQRFCRRNDEVLAGVCFIAFFFVFMFCGTIIGAMLAG